MQSSLTVACRALVMLVCLIAIPLAALFGTQLPDLANRLLDREWDLGSLLPREPLVEAPAFGSVAHGQAWDQPQPRAAPDDAGSGCASGTCRVGASPSDSRPGRLADFSASLAALPDMPPGDAAVGVGAGNRNLNDERAAAGHRAHWTEAEAGINQVAEFRGDRATDQFTQLQRRLRELGATYYLLETWGVRGELYRFHTRIAVGGNANYTRHFEATEPDALRAMRKVLAEVEAWRGAEPTG